MTNTEENFKDGEENPIKQRLRESAAQIRKILLPNRPVRKLKRQSVYGFEDVLISARLDVIIRARDSYC
jgi:hypothetical protein